MSNDKQSIKLYTEEEVRKAIESARENSFGSDFQRWLTKSEESIMKELTPIELPSDEEIWDKADEEDEIEKHYVFIRGAKWMRDKIQGGNNEKQ